MANKVQIIINAKDKAGPVLGQVGKKLSSLGSLAMKGAGLFAGATAAMGAGMVKLAADAAPLEQIEAAFRGIAEASGESGDAMLLSLQQSSAGMVSNRDLMLSYNKAAQLVGDQFANQLPEAMGYLSKVSAATGQDMDYMLNSLVTGVGRLSPMILDNLAIQVSLSEATARAAEMFGVEADNLTKAQQQAGMMDVVLQKLAANTANMPEVAGTAAAGFAQLGTNMANLKDQIGLALLPVITPLLQGFVDLATVYGPQVVTIFEQFAATMSETVGPASMMVNDALTRIGAALGITSEEVTGMDVVMAALKGSLDAVVIGVQAFAVGMQGVAAAVEAVVSTVQAAIEVFNQLAAAASSAAAAMPAMGGAGGTVMGGGIPGFQSGGIVPGPVGSPQLIMAHGGETVMPTHGGSQVIQLVVDGRVLAEVAGGYQGSSSRSLSRMGGHGKL